MTAMVYNLSSHIIRIAIVRKYLSVKHYSTAKSYKLLFFGSDGIALSSLRKINEYRYVTI